MTTEPPIGFDIIVMELLDGVDNPFTHLCEAMDTIYSRLVIANDEREPDMLTICRKLHWFSREGDDYNQLFLTWGVPDPATVEDISPYQIATITKRMPDHA